MITDNSVISTVSHWKDFFNRYYKDELRILSVNDSRSIYINYHNIRKFDVRLAEELIKNPDSVLAKAEEAIQLIDLPIKKQLELRVRPMNFPKHIMIREVRSRNINNIVSVEATIQNISTVNDRIIEGAFECARCKTITVIPQAGDGKFIEPSYCPCNEEKKGVFRLIFKESKFEDYQKIRAQESPEDLRGDEQPRTLDINACDDLTDYTRPGERVILNGIMRSAQRIKNNQKTVFFDYYMDVLSIEREEIAYEDLEITPDDIAKIKSYSSVADPVLLVSNNIAPTIFGLEDVKMGITGLLFGGVKKILPDGSRIRGDIHLLWVGDPGVAKSQVLRNVAVIAPRGMYASGLGVSGAGLTAATVRDDFMGDGSFSLRAGVLALMNGGGVACIDEFGRMREEDREKIHPAMEQQIIPIDRAGFHTTLKSECSVLAAGNPVDGRWDDYKNPGEQIGLDSALLSRFDIIYVTRDVATVERDTKISGHILKVNQAGEQIANGKTIEIKEMSREIPIDILRKWIAYSKRTINPELSDEAMAVLQDYYLKIRGTNGNKDVIHATARQLEGPIRLSEAFARVRLSNVVSEKDAQRAVHVIQDSMKGIRDPVTGIEDMDTSNTGKPQAQIERKRLLLSITKACCRDDGGRTTIAKVVSIAIENGMPELTAINELKTMKGIELWEPATGYIAITKG